MNDAEAGLAESKRTDLEEAYTDEYLTAYRQHIHTLLEWGYADSRSKVQDKEQEPAITGFIAEAINQRLNAPDSPPWCNQISLHDDPPIPGGGRKGRNRWRPDLLFESVERRPRALYYFEAKRLCKPKNKSITAYLGEDGLQCFLSGRYAQANYEAGMLGYIQCDTMHTWKETLQRAIDQDARGENGLLLVSPQQDLQVIQAFPLEWISKHNRVTGKHIIIHHLLLDYCTQTHAT